MSSKDTTPDLPAQHKEHKTNKELRDKQQHTTNLKALHLHLLASQELKTCPFHNTHENESHCLPCTHLNPTVPADPTSLHPQPLLTAPKTHRHHLTDQTSGPPSKNYTTTKSSARSNTSKSFKTTRPSHSCGRQSTNAMHY